MDQTLPRLYKEYGNYSNYRNFPLDLDGLKPVERRVLLSAYKIARQKFVKSRQVDAYTIGHYHPHGECVSGDTIILLLDGRKVKIKDLIGKDPFWVYSCTKDGVIKPGLAHSVRIVKKVSKLYRIYIDNNKYEEVTADHPFMSRDGSYIEAQALKVGDSMMPLYLREEDGKTIFRKFDTIKEVIEIVKTYNHKVTNIEIINLTEEVEVYDMSVEKYHNFATDSEIFVHNCYGTIVQLVRQGFLIGQGNFGSNVGVEPIGPAAPRYTECKMEPRTLDLAFKYVKYVPEIPTELGDIEPAFLPTMMPICLLGIENTMGIGFGYKTYIPCYTFVSLKNRLLWLLGKRKTEHIPVPISDCTVTTSPTELKKLLTTGKNKISVEGIIEENPKQNKVILKSWPPGKRFESILNKFSKELESGLIGFTDLSATDTKIVFQVLRERNRDKIYQDFVEKLKNAIKGGIPFEITVVDVNNKVKVKSVDDLLIDTYKMFSSMNEKMLNEEIKRLNSMIEEYNLLNIIRPTLAECIGNNLNVEATLTIIEKLDMMVDLTAVKELINKYKISKLLTLETDTNELEIQKEQCVQNLKELDRFVADQYSIFK